MSTLGQNIRLGRERLNLTQQEFARKIRVGPNTVEKYEKGLQRPDTQTILNISTVLDIPASELVAQDFQHKNGIDQELEQLVREVGTIKAKTFLKMAKEVEEEDLPMLKKFISDLKILK
ncbi:helix-turn-helix transcriptional regulator [Bacillus sp. DNRA2]|uniref:helix-turn-helix domain-containing protein n=1 Tax=Bacillus sp. DNRA2 TaxID=2723053 RepID=UPI00145CEEC0|nr:helix-turn-helix transcriptional regulator [Bacillus sp. DNRA2]NMD69043.1 helix-turn-helix transcriptional regulator [Bacillus sp. DNRA2]